MPSLAELQDAFAQALLEPASPTPQAVTSHTGRTPARRFDVHRNNVVLSLLEVLASRYPVVRRLLGEDRFRSMALRMIRDMPPSGPVLLEYGRGLIERIEADADLAALPYLADVARLEWLQHESYHAADAEPLTPEALQRVPPERVASLRLVMHPALRLLSSPYPVLAIWRTNTQDDVVRTVSLAEGGDDLWIVRPGIDVAIVKLPAGHLRFAADLAAGVGLAAAGMRAAEAPGFSFQQALAGLIEHGALMGYQMMGNARSGSTRQET